MVDETDRGDNMHNKRYLLLIVITMFFSINIVKSIDFPQKIIAGFSGGITRYGYPLTTISSNVNNYNVKAFCTKWQREAPIPNTECSAVKWSNDGTTNKKASAAIGSIINSLRSSNGSINWDNYFYTVFSINQFLYDFYKDSNILGLGSKLNHAALPTDAKNKIKPYVESAKNIYNNYGNDTFEITSLSFNGVESKLSVTSPGERKGASVDINSNSNSYIIKAVMKCYDKTGGNQIVCDNPSVRDIKFGSRLVNNPKVSITKEGKNTIINIYVDKDSNTLNSNDEVQMIFANNRKYYYAQNYNCGSNYQTVSPNYLKEVYSGEKAMIVNLPVNIVNKDISCEDEISNNPASNLELYNNKYASQHFERLLDIKNPSCSKEEFTSEASCEKTVLTNQWVAGFEIDGRTGKAFCRATMTFNNLVYDNNTASKGDLLFMPKNGNLFGKAIIEYDCNMPEYYQGHDNYRIMYDDVNQIIPKVSLSISYGNNSSYEATLNGKVNKFISSNCILEGDGFSCNTYDESSSENGFGIKFSAEINYLYNNDSRYKVLSDGSLEKCLDCINPYGYGILIPNSISDEITSGELNIKISKKNINDGDTSFSLDQLDKSTTIDATCNFSIKPVNMKKEVLYRTIDVNNPFNKYNGESRFTGGNWCYYETNSDDVTDEEQIVEDTSISDETSVGDNSESNNTSGDTTSNNAKYCKGDNKLVETYIKNRPNSNSKSTPLYSFKLTPANIKSIRNDNKEQVLSNTSNEDKSAFVSNLSNYVTIQKSLCDISERCNIDDIIKNNYNKEES